MEASTLRRIMSSDLTDTMIRIGLIALLAIVSFQVVAPFAGLILWSLMLAIAFYPLQQKLARKLGGRQGLAATILVLGTLVVVGTPTVMLGGSFAAQVHDAYQGFQNETLTLPKPDPSVAQWPVVGPRLYTAWNSAAADLPAFLTSNKAQLQKLALGALGVAASTAGALGLFLGSLIIAGIIMAFGDAGTAATARILSRLTDPERGPRLQHLSTATVRSVANGVVGVAFIQSLLLGVGFIFAGVPAAGVLAFVVLLMGILQLPAMLITAPVIAYIWWAGDSSVAMLAFWTIYLIIAGMADNVLKPLLLGRGVDVPMPVVLIGALGGMVTSGIIGLFTGAVVLAVGYQIFMEWVDSPPPAIPATDPAVPAEVALAPSAIAGG
jgi:predicted PurR-regulated permease PerM